MKWLHWTSPASNPSYALEYLCLAWMLMNVYSINRWRDQVDQVNNQSHASPGHGVKIKQSVTPLPRVMTQFVPWSFCLSRVGCARRQISRTHRFLRVTLKWGWGFDSDARWLTACRLSINIRGKKTVAMLSTFNLPSEVWYVGRTLTSCICARKTSHLP